MMNWKSVNLLNISKPKQWKNLPSSELLVEGYPVYGANGIIGKYSEYNHEHPTLVITCRGATCGSLHITEPKSYINSNAMALDELSADVNIKFLYYALQKRGFNDVVTGSAQPQITREGLRKIKIPLPALSDQIHIVNILSKAESLITQRKESIKLLDEFLKSTFLEMFGDPSKNEKNFKFVELEQLCSTIVDCPHSTPVKSEQLTNYPCIRTSELINGYIVWNSMQYLEESEHKIRTQRLIPEEGDIVYGREGTYGEAIRIPSTYRFSLGQRTMLFRPNLKMTNSIFLWAMVRSEFVYRQAKKKNNGSTVGHVNVKDIKRFQILNPPIEL